MSQMVCVSKSLATLINASPKAWLWTSCCSLGSAERFGAPDGASGWKWEKGGVGMGGKDKGPATEVKSEVGKEKVYKAPEYFKYNEYSFYDIEQSMSPSRCPQPKSGLTDFW